ncbi:MAG: uracil-DNA glycosylase family protein [Candidatus Didemnitutus sp.]|nr:uracil-DNA glycosylase family protein [Candidatus Didemnitutus sp.]
MPVPTVAAVRRHLARLAACEACPRMHKPVVVGRPVVSRVLLVGQAPGDKEPVLGRPFAWTAGKTLFKWFHEALGWTEDETRDRLYFAAVCRCFPGKKSAGGDRVPDDEEIAACSRWLAAEVTLLKPDLILPVGKLAITQVLPPAPLNDVIGRKFRVDYRGHAMDCIPLPHPSGASPWHRMEPGKTLLRQALALVARHPAVRVLR